MDDASRMSGVEGGSGLAQPLEGPARLLGATRREAVRERAAREVLHHDVWAALVLADVEDRDRAGGVREARRRERLAREAAAHRLVVGVRAGEHLDRDDAPEHGVLGPVHLAHAAARDELDVAVALGQRHRSGHRTGLPVLPGLETRPLALVNIR